jgi:hypothetical protein
MGKQSVITTTAAYGERRSRFTLLTQVQYSVNYIKAVRIDTSQYKGVFLCQKPKKLLYALFL